MKAITALLILLVPPFFLYSQSQSGKVIYEYEINNATYLKEQRLNKNPKLAKTIEIINNSLRNAQSKIKFELAFNNSASRYSTQPMLQLEGDKATAYAIIFLDANRVYYLNSRDNIKLTEVDAFGENFIIKENDTSIDWKTTSMSKKIGDYTCYKATAIITTSNSKGIFNKEVVAWYTPQIPFNFGPKGYGGLPGLILELEEGTLRYYATNIALKPKEGIKIVAPTKGKIVTVDEFEQINKNINNNRKKQ